MRFDEFRKQESDRIMQKQSFMNFRHFEEYAVPSMGRSERSAHKSRARIFYEKYLRIQFSNESMEARFRETFFIDNQKYL